MVRNTALAFALLVLLGSTACLPQKPYTTLGDQDWASPLDPDLKIAAGQLAADLTAQGYPGVHVLWAGARGREYALSRGPTGTPIAKFAQVEYAFQLADGKCYLDSDFSTLQSGPLLTRQNDGTGYGDPRIRGFAPPKGGRYGRHEVTCDAVASAKGGVHEPF